jgi:GTP cyclohydrolase I
VAAKSTDAQVFRGKVDVERIEYLATELLIAIGEDPTREGLKDTPRRYAKWWREFIEYDSGKTATLFNTTNQLNSMVVVSGMKVWSLCEHHLLPFWCEVTVGYIPNRQVLGLSKFARIAHQYAHRLQLQEQLANQIAGTVTEVTNSTNVAVLCRGEHLCMTMRGIETPALMTTTVFNGVFHHDPESRNTFLSIALSGQ